MSIKVIFGAESNYCSRIGYALSQVDQQGMNFVFCPDKQQIMDNLSDAGAIVIKESLGITSEEIENGAGKKIPMLKLVSVNTVEPDEVCLFQGASMMVQDISTKIARTAAEEPAIEIQEEPDYEFEMPGALHTEPFIADTNEEVQEEKVGSDCSSDDIMTLRMDIFEQLYTSDLKNLPPIRMPEVPKMPEILIQADVMPMEEKKAVQLRKESTETTTESTMEIEEEYEAVERSMVVLFVSAKGGSGNTVGACAAAKYLASNGERILFLDLSIPGGAEGFEDSEFWKTCGTMDYYTGSDVVIAKPKSGTLRGWLEENGVGRSLRELTDASECSRIVMDVTCTYDALSETIFENAGTIIYTCDGTVSGITKHAALEKTVEEWESVLPEPAKKWFLYNRYTMEGSRVASDVPYIGGIMMEDEDEGIAAFSDRYAKKSFWKKLI